MSLNQNYIEELRQEVAKHKGRAGVPIEITNRFAEALLEQIDSAVRMLAGDFPRERIIGGVVNEYNDRMSKRQK